MPTVAEGRRNAASVQFSRYASQARYATCLQFDDERGKISRPAIRPRFADRGAASLCRR
jgi:hypothetical protein